MSSNSNHNSWRMSSQTGMSYSPLPPILPAPSPPNYRESNENKFCFQCSATSSRRPRNQSRRSKRNGSRKNKDRDQAYWLRVIQSPILRDEERLLVRLKGLQDYPWKIIQSKFNNRYGKKMRQPALQMRMTRLGDKMDIMWAQERETLFRSGFRSHHAPWMPDTSSSRDLLMLPPSDRGLPDSSVSILESFSSTSAPAFTLYTPEIGSSSAEPMENVCFQSDPQRNDQYHHQATLSHPNTWNSMYNESAP